MLRQVPLERRRSGGISHGFSLIRIVMVDFWTSGWFSMDFFGFLVASEDLCVELNSEIRSRALSTDFPAGASAAFRMMAAWTGSSSSGISKSLGCPGEKHWHNLATR